ncbi:hypothetical protein ACWDMR_13675 [Streptomyces althioticus]|uniref:hypothetical protein n=1 Tax=Actinomycetes TaxID=1760 RepID=UPI0005255745|nr:hypothetical protein [Actinospica acidiphila]MBM4830148.1 hypothetical protein [Actinospica acidiphila]
MNTNSSPVQRYGDERDPRAYVAPAVATVLGVMLAPLALLFGALSVMATDSCGPDDCSTALTTALDVVHGTLFLGGLLGVAACVAAWLLPRTRRWAVPRVWLAGLSLLPWLTVITLVFNLPQG